MQAATNRTESMRTTPASRGRRAWRGVLALAALGALAMGGNASAHVQAVGDERQGSMAFPGGNIRAVYVAHTSSLLAFYVNSYSARPANSTVTPLVYIETRVGGGPEYALWRFGSVGVVVDLQRRTIAARALFQQVNTNTVRYVLTWASIGDPPAFAWHVESRYTEPDGRQLVIDFAPNPPNRYAGHRG